MKRLLSVVVLLVILPLAACPSMQTAAQVMKSYRISLGAFQDAEIATFQHGNISAAQHVKDQADVEKLANFGIIADKALVASDKATLTTDIQNGLTVVQDIETNDVTAIGNQTDRASVELAVAGLSNLLQQVAIAAGVKP